MTIKWKLMTIFGVLIILLVFFGIIVTANMAVIQEQFRFVIKHDAPVIANANQLLKLVVDMETGQRGFCLTQNEEFLEPYNYANTKFHELLKVEKKLVSDNPSQVMVLNKIDDLIEQWHQKAATPEMAKAREVAAAKDKNEQYKAIKQLSALLEAGIGKALIDKIRKEFSEFIKTEEQLTKKRYATASQKTLNTRKTALMLIVFSALFGFIIASLTTHAIISSVKKLIKGTEIIASGNLMHRIDIKSKNEIGQLSNSFNRMVEKLQQARYQVDREITERKLAEEALSYQKQRLSYILEGTNVGTWEWNVQTGEVIFNEHWAEIIGYTLEDLAPVSIDTWMEFCHSDDLEKSEELLNKHFDGELDFYEFEARMRNKNGDWVWVLDRGRVSTWTNDGKPLLMCGTHQDITERKQFEERIQHLALYDTLTDLPNRDLFFNRLDYAISHAERYQHLVALLYIDLDGFKPVNDTFGHDIGDAVLQEVAKRIKNCIRDTDTAARLGGDEFAVILQDIQQRESASIVAEKIIKSLADPLAIGKTHCNIGASIGISIYDHDAQESDVMLRHADIAMYNVKKKGKNNYLFYEFSELTLD